MNEEFIWKFENGRVRKLTHKQFLEEELLKKQIRLAELKAQQINDQQNSDMENKQNSVQIESKINKVGPAERDIEGVTFVYEKNIPGKFFECSFSELKYCFPKYKTTELLKRAILNKDLQKYHVYRVKNEADQTIRKYAIQLNTTKSDIQDLITKINSCRKQIKTK